MLLPVRSKKKKGERQRHGISRPQFLVSLHITDNLGMLQNISSLKYFHGSNGELKQMGFQCDLSTYQTLLTQIIVQQSCSRIHVTFWEKHQGYSEKGWAARGQLGWLAPRAAGWGWHLCPAPRLYAKGGAQCSQRAP